MEVLTKDNYLVPFWGERSQFVTGLDPLSLQTTSEATYALLMPGLNNVTDRLRYYGFYCWVLHSYFSDATRKTFDKKSQRRFIRRAEFIIAVITQSETTDFNGISGRDKAKKMIEDAPSSYDIAEGADQTEPGEEGTYWQYSEGVFGQYYKGAMRDLGLIVEAADKIYNITTDDNGVRVSGQSLAFAFEKSIPGEQNKVFIRSVNSGVLKNSDVPALFQSFNLTSIPDNSEEHDLYKQLLLAEDYPLLAEDIPLRFRSRSIDLLLAFLKDNKNGNIRDFPVHAYSVKGFVDDKPDDCLFGWYYYQLNEYWQYLCLNILNSVLQYLEQVAGNHNIHLQNFVQELSNCVMEELLQLKVIKKPADRFAIAVEQAQKQEEEGWLDEIFDNRKNEDFISSIAFSFGLLFKLFYRNKDELHALKSYSGDNKYGNERDGNFVDFALQAMEQMHDATVSVFVRDFLYKRIIYRHHHVAFHKMGNGTLSTQKFLLEDGSIRLLGFFPPSFSSPRLTNLCGFMIDLGWLKSDNNITQQGSKILKDLRA